MVSETQKPVMPWKLASYNSENSMHVTHRETASKIYYIHAKQKLEARHGGEYLHAYITRRLARNPVSPPKLTQLGVFTCLHHKMPHQEPSVTPKLTQLGTYTHRFHLNTANATDACKPKHHWWPALTHKMWDLKNRIKGPQL